MNIKITRGGAKVLGTVICIVDTEMHNTSVNDNQVNESVRETRISPISAANVAS